MTSRDPSGQTCDPVNEYRVKHKANGAMGQIPRSIERISSLFIYLVWLLNKFYETFNESVSELVSTSPMNWIKWISS